MRLAAGRTGTSETQEPKPEKREALSAVVVFFLDSQDCLIPRISAVFSYCRLIMHVFLSFLLFSAFHWCLAALWAFGPPDATLTAAEKAKHLLLLPSSHELKAAG